MLDGPGPNVHRDRLRWDFNRVANANTNTKANTNANTQCHHNVKWFQGRIGGSLTEAFMAGSLNGRSSGPRFAKIAALSLCMK